MATVQEDALFTVGDSSRWVVDPIE